MASKQQTLPAKPAPATVVVTKFDPVSMRAPFFLRCGAIAFDYLLMVIWPVLGLLVGRVLGIDGAKLLAGELNNIAWLVAILVGLSNIVLLPLVTGQSLGKMITGLRIVSSDGAHPSVGTMLFRQTIGYLITLVSVGIGFFISAFSSRGRSLHDYVTDTQVAYGRLSYRSRS